MGHLVGSPDDNVIIYGNWKTNSLEDRFNFNVLILFQKQNIKVDWQLPNLDMVHMVLQNAYFWSRNVNFLI